jgi:xanthosine utilization system XapX-like protein
MRFAIDSGKLLYALGVLFAAAALLYFVRDVVFDLSITVKAALLLLGFVAFFIAGLALERDVLDVVAFALSGVSYVVFVGYVVVRYSPGETGTFLLLAASAGLFVGLGYTLREGIPTPSRRTAAVAFGGLLVVSGVLVGADALSGGVTYDVQTTESVTVTVADAERTGDEYALVSREMGTVTAANPSPFLRALEFPAVSGCLVGPTDGAREEVYVDVDSRWDEDTIGRSTTITRAITGEFHLDVNRTEPRTLAVERGINCNVERSEPTIAIQVGETERID